MTRPPAWQVPAHDTALFGPRRYDHALVIPVINEGERIRRQLEAISAADPPVDLIIADGGSTDGSLDPERLARQGVRALLTKRDKGRLGAQLRMAYAWCLDEGYRGVVTIDGNGKDDVAAVARFVDRLEAGCDYVQGSRYARGGMAINTPLDRTIGNRLIHAPLLSLASRHWLTDTTNGFRAYSATLLRDPRVAPFRDVFTEYELLFYLTARAGRLGYSVCEIPVVRRYPTAGAVPTKIAGWAGKRALLAQLIAVVRGAYDPD